MAEYQKMRKAAAAVLIHKLYSTETQKEYEIQEWYLQRRNKMYTIGRSRKNDFVVTREETWVSKRHLKVSYQNRLGYFKIQDNETRNGTVLVRGDCFILLVPKIWYRLIHGDVLLLDPYVSDSRLYFRDLFGNPEPSIIIKSSSLPAMNHKEVRQFWKEMENKVVTSIDYIKKNPASLKKTRPFLLFA